MRVILLSLIAVQLLSLPLQATSPSTARAKHGLVVSAHRLASEVGIDILKRGGNAVDAAVAVGFALAVVFPEAGNIGGGGFMMVRKFDGDATVIDFREKSPKAASRSMYLDSTGNVTEKSINGHLSVGVPGTVAGLIKALKMYGTMKLRTLIQPSINLAERGFVVDERLAGSLESYKDVLSCYPSTTQCFAPNGKFYQEGETLRQPELASTLRRIQQDGANGFYSGRTAQLIVEEMQKGGGLITKKDLEDYQATTRKPIKCTYRGYEIVSIPPPSSGGVCLFQLLNLVEGYSLSSMGYHSSRAVHVMAEAMKRVYADRAEFMGDPGFSDVPADPLISKKYAETRRKEIDTLKATPGNLVHHGNGQLREGQNTTHYAVRDASGNIVATTYTLNDLFGSKVVVEEAGFFLNDEMDDFSAKPGAPNIYGLIGGEANAIQPEKRPLSSMTPTIVLKDGKPFLVLGARGGSKIITAVFETIVNFIDFHMNIQEAVDAPRFHHQCLPDTLIYEKFCFPEDVLQNLRAKGHATQEIDYSLGQLEALFVDPDLSGWIYGAPDPREQGVAVGY